MIKLRSFNLNNREFLISFLVLLVFIFIFLITAFQTGLLDSGFRYFVDDHQISVMQKDLSNTGLWETIKIWIKYDRTLHRFRPFFQIQVVILTQIFGTNSFLWFLYITLLGAFTAFFLFYFGRTLYFSVLIALIFPIATLLGNQSEIWMRPMIPDSQGMFFLSLTLFFLALSSQNIKYSKFNSILAFLSAIMMSLCKESYIIFIPTLILLKIWLDTYFHKHSLCESVKLNRILIGSFSTVIFLEVTYILFFLGTQGTGYAGVDQKSLNLYYIFRTLNDLFFQSYGLLIIVGIGLILILSRLKKESFINTLKELAPFVFFLLTALIPQTLLYAKSGIVAAFYLFPFITVASLLLCKILSLINSYVKWLGILSITCISIILISQLSPTWAMYSQQAKDSKSINSLLNQIELCSKDSYPILVVVNPKVRYEVADGLQRVLRNVKKREELFIATYGLNGSLFYSNTLSDAEKNWSFLDPKWVLAMYKNKTLFDIKNKKDIQTIVIFDGLDDDFFASNNEWFSAQEYQATKFDISFSPAMLYCKQ